MADYYPLLARALEALPNSSPAMRKAVYDRARNALTAQLRSLDPPVSEADIGVEQKALDAAIERLEAGLAASAPAPALAPKPAPKPEPAPRPEPAPEPKPAPQAKPAPEVTTATPPPVAPPPEPETLPEAASMPTAVPLSMQGQPTAGSSGPKPEAAAPEPAKPQQPKPDEPKQPEPKPEEAKPRSEFVAFVPPPRKKPPEPVAATVREEAPSAPEPSNANAAPSLPPASPAAPGTNGASRRPKIDVVAPPASKSRALRNAFVGGLLALVIGAIAVAAFLLRDEPSSLSQDADGDGQTQAEQGEQKFGDRVDGPRSEGETKRPGPPPSVPEVTVAQRGILYEENTANPQAEPRTTTGRVVWRLEPVNGEQGQPLQNAVRMTADFSDVGLLLTMTIRKNIEATLPASHTVELDFTMSGQSASQVVQEIGLLQLKDELNARGTTVSGLPVRVRDNLFLIGLSNLPDDIVRNRDLLLQKSWFDLGFKFRSGQRGVLSFEKGASGAQVFESAFSLWGN